MSKEAIHHNPHEQLVELLTSMPQRTPSGEISYLITNGFAIDAATGVRRPHDDVDVLTFGDPRHFARFGIDAFTPQDYLAGMKLDPQFLKQTAQRVTMDIEGSGPIDFEIVHPAVIMVQKATPYLYDGRLFPRDPKDRNEVKNILKYWYESISDRHSWIPIIQTAITALPNGRRAGMVDNLTTTLNQISSESRLKRRPTFRMMRS